MTPNAIFLGGPADGEERDLEAPFPTVTIGTPLPQSRSLVGLIRELLNPRPTVSFSMYEFAGADDDLRWVYEFLKERPL